MLICHFVRQTYILPQPRGLHDLHEAFNVFWYVILWDKPISYLRMLACMTYMRMQVASKEGTDIRCLLVLTYCACYLWFWNDNSAACWCVEISISSPFKTRTRELKGCKSYVVVSSYVTISLLVVSNYVQISLMDIVFDIGMHVYGPVIGIARFAHIN